VTVKLTKRNWIRIFSPCVLTSLFSIVAIVISLTEFEKSGGWSILGVIIYLPFLLILLTIDGLIKTFSRNTLFLWLAEIGLIALIIFVFLRWTR
jgi:hypothetical protein